MIAVILMLFVGGSTNKRRPAMMENNNEFPIPAPSDARRRIESDGNLWERKARFAGFLPY